MKMKEEDKRALDLIGQAIFDKKGMNILAIDVRGMSTMTDYYVIAEGSVERHVQAIAKEVQDRMASEGNRLWHKESDQEGAWVVLDFAEIIVHLLIPDLREKYDLEELWRKGHIVNLDIRYEQQTG